MTTAIARYAAVTAAVVALVGWLLSLAFHDAGSGTAILVSALVAVAVQLVAFTITRAMTPQNVIAGWGTGALLRMSVLFIYAFVAVKGLGMAAAPALLSLATFFFLSTLLEPLFLRR